MNNVKDIAGIGFGPANIALAICLNEISTDTKHCYVEAHSTSSWQSQMMLGGADIQNHPLRDFVTPRNPQSHFTFLNYLKRQGRLFEFLNLPMQYPLRQEYAAYIRWAADHFNDRVTYNARVEAIEVERIHGPASWKIHASDGSEVSARCLIIGTGRTKNVPRVFEPLLGSRIFHLNDYLKNISSLPREVRRIGVVGASQSAVEILLDLLNRFPDKEIFSIQRSFGFRLKDVSPFSDRVYLPEFVDYFYSLPKQGKQNIQRQLRSTNYSSADADVIQQLYIRIYEERLSGKDRFHLLNNRLVQQAAPADSGFDLQLQEVNTGDNSRIQLDAVVLATGFLDLSGDADGEAIPPLLTPFARQIALDGDGAVGVTRDYRVKFQDDSMPPVYLNGLCESSHGFGDAGSFSLLSIRSEAIARSALTTVHKSQGRSRSTTPPQTVLA